MTRGLKIIALGLAAATALASSASAGGFSRGTADTDILYEQGNFNMRAGVTIVAPNREYSSYEGVPGLVGTNAADNYVIPSAAMKLNFTDDLACAGTLTTPYGGSETYAVPTPSGKTSESFTITEYGGTCSYKFQVGPGNLHVIGGLFADVFDYSRTNATPFGGAGLELDGTDVGYRVGIGYDYSEIALRAQVMYRSSTEYGATGGLTLPDAVLAFGAATAGQSAGYVGATQAAVGAGAAAAAGGGDVAAAVGAALTNQVVAGNITPAEAGAIGAAVPGILGAAAAGTATALDATGTGMLPQSLEVKLQSGVAPGWLVFGSVKWTDWSVLDQLIVSAPAAGVLDRNQYFWRDGWTVTAGVGHLLTENVSIAAGLTWDRGVGTGYDLSSDTWTGFTGIGMTTENGGQLQLGGAITRITSAETTMYPGANYATDGGWAYAVSGSFKLRF